MEILSGRYTLDTAPGTFPLSTDSMLLADFFRMKGHGRVLDLGSGCGILGLLLCARFEQCVVTGIEMDPGAHESALCNISENNLGSRLYSLCGDLRSMPVEPGSFDYCISNPPYFPGGEASKKTPFARREDTCSPAELFSAASKALKFGGDFFLVHKPERLGQLCGEACRHRLEPKRLRLIRHKADGPVILILLQCRKGGKPGMVWEELCLYHPDGSPTADYRRIYHI